MGGVREGWAFLTVGLYGCTLLVGAPDARYDGGAGDARAEGTTQASPRDAKTADTVALDGREPDPDAGDGGCDAAHCGDAALKCPAGGCDAPAENACPHSGNPCTIVRWNVEDERCTEGALADCTLCGAEGRCAGGRCWPQGVLFFDDFEAESLGPTWSSPSQAAWHIDDGHAHVGQQSLGSGAIANRSATEVSLSLTDVSAFARLRFWYRLDTEDRYDTLTFQVHDAYLGTWSGELDWDFLEVPLAPGGDVTMTWRYTKDAANTTGEDRVWLDEVSVYLACRPTVEEEP